MTGFQSPNYTQTPNDLFDTMLPEMGLAELKVVMCVVRHTFGYHRDEFKMSIRFIARYTGLTANSVMDGAKQAEDHGLIERYQEGQGTTLWRAVVSVVPTETPRRGRRDTRVSPTETQVGLNKETKKLLNTPAKPDLLDAELHYHLKPKAIKDAITKHFQLTPNWEAKYNRQFMEWAVESDITPEQVERAADVWRMDKRFNWKAPDLRGIQENWLMLVAPDQEDTRGRIHAL